MTIQQKLKEDFLTEIKQHPFPLSLEHIADYWLIKVSAAKEEGRQEEREEIIKQIHEAMFQIRETGTGETYKAHKALFDLRMCLENKP